LEDDLNSKPVHGTANPVVVREVLNGANGGDGRTSVVHVFHANVTHLLGGDRLKNIKYLIN
jgi:hypothetical protein